MKFKTFVAAAAFCVASAAQAASPPALLPIAALVPGGVSVTVFDLGDTNYLGSFEVGADVVGLSPSPFFSSSLLSGTFEADNVVYDLVLDDGHLRLSSVMVSDPISMKMTIVADSSASGGLFAGAVTFAEVQAPPAVPEPETLSLFAAGLLTILFLFKRSRRQDALHF